MRPQIHRPADVRTGGGSRNWAIGTGLSRISDIDGQGGMLILTHCGLKHTVLLMSEQGAALGPRLLVPKGTASGTGSLLL
jgi:hypothetical protein